MPASKKHRIPALLLLLPCVTLLSACICPSTKTLSSITVANAGSGYSTSKACETDRKAGKNCAAFTSKPKSCDTYCSTTLGCIGESGGAATAVVGSACYIDQSDDMYYYKCVQTYRCNCI